MRPSLPCSLVLLAMAAACQSSPAPFSKVHENTAFSVHYQVAEGLQRNTDRLAGTRDLDADGFGLQLETFLDAGSSITFSLERRVYDIDAPFELPAGALELRTGGRLYLNSDSALQPFFLASLSLGLLDDEANDHLEGLVGIGAGAGLAWFFDPNAAIEARVIYELALVAVTLDRPDDDNDLVSDGEIFGPSFWLGASWLF